MGELIILDVVLLLGLAVLPRHVGRSFLAIRRLARDGLRAATGPEPVRAVDAVRPRVPASAASGGGRSSRWPLLPVAGGAAVVLAAGALVVAIGATATTGPDKAAAEPARWGPDRPLEAPEAEEEKPRLACDGEWVRRDVLRIRIL